MPGGYPLSLLRRCWRMFLAVAQIVVPIMLIVEVANYFGLVDLLGRAMSPAMGLLNLPAEAGIIWATTLITSFYGGLALIAALAPSLDMTVGQFSALAAMMLFAHGLPVEQAIVRRAGASFGATAALRLGSAVLFGGAVAWGSSVFGVLTEPVSFEWISAWVQTDSGTGGVLGWIMSTLYSLALIFAVITVLAALLDALEKLGITRRFTAAMMPLLRFSGLSAQVAPVTTVGVLLGLTYGGALIIEESERKNFSARTRFLALSWLSLSHSLIEDTIIVVALGADIWVVLAGRIVFTLLVMALLARLTDRGGWQTAPAGVSAQQG